MDLTHQLANALQAAVDHCDSEDAASIDQIAAWRKLIKKVQDLDSVFYLPAKCKAAGCEGGTHVCGQGEMYDTIAHQVAGELFGEDDGYTDVQVALIKHGIARVLGEVEIGEERKIIYERLSDILTSVQEAEIHPTMSPRYTMVDVRWLHAVATKCLSLYTKEQTRSWCMTHRKQMRYCEDCGNDIRTKALSDLASAMKKIMPRETLDTIIAAANPEDEFLKILRGLPDGPTEVAF